MAHTKDYYQTLGVERTATEDDIRKAYRRLARQYHPDVNKDPDAARRFNEITEAYEVLSDKEKRSNYDRFGHAGTHGSVSGAGGRRSPGWTPGSGGFQGDFSAGDFSDIFEQMFRGQGASPFGGGGRSRARRGADIEHELAITFMTAALGGTEQLRLTPAGKPAEMIEVKIPPGIEDGAKLRIRGRGGPGVTASGAEGEHGDLLLTIRVGEHPFFRREGLDVLADVPITIAEAALGATVTVPLLKGTVDIKIPPGTSSGQRVRVKGRGIRDAKGREGDFYAVIQIVAPDSLSAEARQALSQIALDLQNPRKSGPLADVLGQKP